MAIHRYNCSLSIVYYVLFAFLFYNENVWNILNVSFGANVLTMRAIF